MIRLFLNFFFTTLITIFIVFYVIMHVFLISIPSRRYEFHSYINATTSLLVELLESVPESEYKEHLRAINERSDIQYSIIKVDDPTLAEGLLSAIEQRGLITWEHDDEFLSFYVPFNNKQFVLRIGPVEIRDEHIQEKMIIFIFISVAIIALVGFIINIPLWRNIKKFSETTLQISRGNLKARANISSKDPIGIVARRFDQMADSIQRLFDGQKQLLQAVSHELRTPVSRIHFELELLSTALTKADREKRKSAIEDHLGDLEKLLDELLIYVRFDPETELSDAHQFQVKNVIDEAMANNRSLLEKTEFRLEVDIPETIKIDANPRYFQRVVDNLLKNALQYTATRVIVRSYIDGNFVVIEVNDDGPGVPESERERIFEPFTRLDSSRSRDSGGVGLGLAIARRILERYKGSISVSKSDIGGARFSARWPVSKKTN